ALDPAGQQGAGGVDVGHDVHAPLALPDVVGRVLVAAGGHARVREEHVDGPGLLDERAGGGLVGDVERARLDDAAGIDALGVEIGRDDAPRAALDERAHQGAADPTRGAGDRDGPALGIHARRPYARAPGTGRPRAISARSLAA